MYKILSEHRQVFKAKSFLLFFIWEIIFFAVFLYFALVVFVKKRQKNEGNKNLYKFDERARKDMEKTATKSKSIWHKSGIYHPSKHHTFFYYWQDA